MAAVFGAETRKARKVHTCAYCRARIREGSTYQRWVSADCGTAVTVVAHPECVSMWIMMEPYEDTVPTEWDEFRRDCYDRMGDCRPFPWEP